MKKTILSLSLLLSVFLMAVAVNAAILSPGLNNLAADFSLSVSGINGEDVYFTSEQFADAVGVAGFNEIKITSLPDETMGTLYFGDTAVCVGQVIKEEKIELLRFEPSGSVEKTAFGFTFDSSYEMICNVVYTLKQNNAPTVITSPALNAVTSTVSVGEMKGYDADGDSIRYEIVDYPDGGKIVFDSATGEFTYSAGKNAMSDSFTYRVRDSFGEYSDVGEFIITVSKNKPKNVFSDLEYSNVAVAASALVGDGVMNSERIEGSMCFLPDKEVSRLEFLVSCMDVFGAANIPAVNNTGFYDDAAIPEKYKGYVYSASKLGIVDGSVINGELCFRPDAPITKAEAATVLNNIIGYEAETVDSLPGVPSWAMDSVCAMYELGLYDLNEGNADGASSITKSVACEMLYNVSCLLGE